MYDMMIAKTRSGARTIGDRWPISDGQTALACISTISKEKTSCHIRSPACRNAMDAKLHHFFAFNLGCVIVGVCNISVFPRNFASHIVGSDTGESWGEAAAAGEGCSEGLVIVGSHQAA